ncbi:MAG TPA: hypothetical protein VH164_01720, partial [Ktedonobacteraceae bacterium]|nr:hypothetical protein [Ktedonobacteraceae bacterium]
LPQDQDYSSACAGRPLVATLCRTIASSSTPAFWISVDFSEVLREEGHARYMCGSVSLEKRGMYFTITIIVPYQGEN